jgi:hypothetical protein
LVAQLRAAGHEVLDFGAHTLSHDDDYPDFVVPLARAVVAGKVDRGLGASVCADKIEGVRACLIHDHFSAKQGVEDDHMNILLYGRTKPWDLRCPGISSRRSWPPSSVKPSGICDAWVKWLPSKQERSDEHRNFAR